ncbi:MAG: glycosyltransferase family 4 protein [Candidatus Berkelbacteria bacterium]|nr:glycosyltransferase family 4 protein [Candidatus Berkelbacteria bacterium]
MRIAQVAPLWNSVPPKGYGGTELIVSNITNELSRRGHKVTLFASKDSKTQADISSVIDKSLGESVEKGEIGPDTVIKYEVLNNLIAFLNAEKFDLIHCHSHYLGAAFAFFVNTPSVHTLHSYPRGAELEIMRKTKTVYCSISNKFREFTPGLEYVATVYNGIDLSRLPFRSEYQDNLITSGRLSPKKGFHDAILVAIKNRKKLKIGGPLPKSGYGKDSWLADEEYYIKKIKPFLKTQYIEHVGEIHQDQKDKFMTAKAFLLPIHWEEPFGLVMIEAMACGTPVVAFRRGSVPEIVIDGKTGFIVKPNDINAMAKAVKRIYSMPENEYQAMRKACREHVEKNFTVEKMVDGYEKVYEEVLRRHK